MATMEPSLLTAKLEPVRVSVCSVLIFLRRTPKVSNALEKQDVDIPGIIPRSCEHIFDHIANDVTGTEYTIKCSFLEIYKESIRDLLDSDRVNLKVRETPSRGVWVQDLSEHVCIDVISKVAHIVVCRFCRRCSRTLENW